VFLCCGDALFDLFALEAGATVDIQGTVKLTGNVGGSPLNVAAGLARLGHHSRYFTKLSSDMFGRRMRSHLANDNIDVSLSLATDLNTTLAIVETNAAGSASYVFYTDNTADVSITVDELPASLADDIRVVHFGSYTTVVEPTATSLMALAKREKNTRLICYDPNIRPSIEPDIDKWRDTYAGYAAAAGLIKASDEDIETLLGKGREEQFVADCFSCGVQLVFITRGPDGASGFTPTGKVVNAKSVSVSVEDTVGAGDSFQAATLHWLLRESHLSASAVLEGEVDIAACMAFALKAAAITCTRKGADLPYLHEISLD